MIRVLSLVPPFRGRDGPGLERDTAGRLPFSVQPHAVSGALRAGLTFGRCVGTSEPYAWPRTQWDEPAAGQS